MNELTLSDRIRGMIWGQFAGDAAALGLHWIYDLDEITLACPDGVKGFEAPRAGHYHEGKHPGDQTHYGDAALLLLESVAAVGAFDVTDFGRRFYAFFAMPDTVTYRDHATKETLQHLEVDTHNFRNGADDNQPATITRLAPVVAVHGASVHEIEALTRFCQNNAQAVSYCLAHARILAALLEGAELQMALAQTDEAEPTADVTKAESDLPSTVVQATLRFGQSCPLPNVFPAAVHAVLRSPDNFRNAILQTLAAGGDSAARASIIGAWLGAAGGLQSVPADWREKLTAAPRIHEAVERLITKTAVAYPE